jgi:hypothetical protein
VRAADAAGIRTHRRAGSGLTAMIAAPERLTIGRLSALTGATAETIRYYERIRLLVPPPRR